MSNPIAAVKRPDSASQFQCWAAPFIAGGIITHHLVPRAKGLTCIHCKRTDAEIRQEAGL